ncbi:hypothetical protein BsWGS_17249 [Bradybaena similaris]
MTRSTDKNVFSRPTSTLTNPDRGGIVPSWSRQPRASKAILTCTRTAEGHTKSVLSVFATDHLLFTGSRDFSSSVLRPPWFMDNAPMLVNYNGAGFVLGHGVFHTVDKTGVTLHINGTFGKWFGNATDIAFLQRVDCMIDQFNRYFYKPAERHLNGKNSVSENIGDNGGMKLAYKAYRNYTSSRISEELKLPSVNFTNDQVFFLRAAQGQRSSR